MESRSKPQHSLRSNVSHQIYAALSTILNHAKLTSLPLKRNGLPLDSGSVLRSDGALLRRQTPVTGHCAFGQQATGLGAVFHDARIPVPRGQRAGVVRIGAGGHGPRGLYGRRATGECGEGLRGQLAGNPEVSAPR